MKKATLLLFLLLYAKGYSQVLTTNVNPVGMEHNQLFNASTRFNVTMTGPELNIGDLFDGKLNVSYTNVGPTETNPTVILIENLSNYHLQRGGWVGWTTRYWQALRFKIEGYDEYDGANTWKTIADYSQIDYPSFEFYTKIPYHGNCTKLKFTFYKGSGEDGRFGISELLFIHPEAVTPYQGLFSENIGWSNNGTNAFYNKGNIGIGTNAPSSKLDVRGTISTPEIAFRNSDGGDDSDPYRLRKVQGSNDNNWLELQLNDNSNESFRIYGNSCEGFGCAEYSTNLYHSFDTQGNVYHKGNVGIGTTDPKNKLSVNGTIWAKEVKVSLTDAADWVFDHDYQLKPLNEVEKYIKANKHLPEIPSAEEFRKNDLNVSEMTNKLLQKIEELTLYTIEQDKTLHEMQAFIKKQNQRIEKLEKR